jgi:hypothetical protein
VTAPSSSEGSAVPRALLPVPRFRSFARVAKLADAPGLGPGGVTRGGSSPPSRILIPAAMAAMTFRSSVPRAGGRPRFSPWISPSTHRFGALQDSPCTITGTGGDVHLRHGAVTPSRRAVSVRSPETAATDCCLRWAPPSGRSPRAARFHDRAERPRSQRHVRRGSSRFPVRHSLQRQIQGRRWLRWPCFFLGARGECTARSRDHTQPPGRSRSEGVPPSASHPRGGRTTRRRPSGENGWEGGTPSVRGQDALTPVRCPHSPAEGPSLQ